MLTREEHTKLRESYAARQGSPIFALAIVLRHQLEVEDVRRHFARWRLRPESHLTDDDQRVLDEGGSTFEQLREQHELELIHELFEVLETGTKTAADLFLSAVRGEKLEAPPADPPTPEPKATKKKGGAE